MKKQGANGMSCPVVDPCNRWSTISKGQNLDSSISLFCTNGNDTRADQNNMMILRDAFMDATRSILVYAIIDSLAKNVVMNGEDCSRVALLPCGIAIDPNYF